VGALRRVLDALVALHATLRWSGSLYRCVAQTLRVQRAALEVSLSLEHVRLAGRWCHSGFEAVGVCGFGARRSSPESLL